MRQDADRAPSCNAFIAWDTIVGLTDRRDRACTQTVGYVQNKQRSAECY